jgi:hypothetical protein
MIVDCKGIIAALHNLSLYIKEKAVAEHDTSQGSIIVSTQKKNHFCSTCFRFRVPDGINR